MYLYLNPRSPLIVSQLIANVSFLCEMVKRHEDIINFARTRAKFFKPTYVVFNRLSFLDFGRNWLGERKYDEGDTNEIIKSSVSSVYVFPSSRDTLFLQFSGSSRGSFERCCWSRRGSRGFSHQKPNVSTFFFQKFYHSFLDMVCFVLF